MPQLARYSDSGFALAALLLLLAIASARPALAQFGPEMPPRRAEPAADDKAAYDAKAAYEHNLANYKADPDKLVLPGLVADRKTRQVRIWAKATGVGYGDPVEFFLIPPDSGKDYEALAVGFVRPGDVHRALEFIGMKAGRAVNFAANQFWPKGQRVRMTCEWLQPPDANEPAGKPSPQRARAEDLVINVHTRKPLPPTGLVFTGSYRIKPDDAGEKELYAADVVDPRSIASNFNCRASVMDVPRQAVQGDVYGSQKLNPAYRFTPGQAMRILLEPEHKDGQPRVIDLSLRAVAPARDDAPLQAIQFTLTDPNGKQFNGGPTIVHVLAEFNTFIEAGQDPFVTVRVDDRITLSQVRELYKLLMSLDSENGIRLDAPPDGHLFCRAFFPREDWRVRANRLGRPWELHLELKDNAPAATLILPADEIDDNKGMGDLTFKINSAEELARILAEKSDRFSQTVYIFATPKLAYGSLMSLIRPAMKTHPTMYVFGPK